MAVMHVFKHFRISTMIFCAAMLALSWSGAAQAQSDAAKIVGPNECAECHKNETAVWKGTHHFATFTAMHKTDEAKSIAKKMKIKRIKADSLCLNCHFTVKTVKNKPKAIAGISCESCHSPSKDWVKIHSEFSGKKKGTESKAEAAARWASAEKNGMIRPKALYLLAKNCYSCHVVPQEDLVNVGGHPAGSKFELVSWSQGEVRHNLWYSDGSKNEAASPERKRMMFIVGKAVELETALLALRKVTKVNNYVKKMAGRLKSARKGIAAVTAALPDVPELAAILKTAKGLKKALNNEAGLTAAAAEVQKQTLSLAVNYDGSKFAAVDKLIPGPGKYKGKPAK